MLRNLWMTGKKSTPMPPSGVNKKIMGSVLIGAAIFILAGCYKDRTVIFDTAAEVTRPVSFATDIVPIFSANCSVSGCHVSGAKAPDLSAANAFATLTVGNYINTGEPESSALYLWMTGKKSTPMPPSGVNIDNNALVLAWIKQGAQNN